jgi:molybdopterin biosynthesis enzyme
VQARGKAVYRSGAEARGEHTVGRGRHAAAHQVSQACEAQLEAALRKAAGRTEYQRGILLRDDGEWKVKTTGQQGSGVLRSMSEANCFIVLEHERGKVQAGELVQLFDGLA